VTCPDKAGGRNISLNVTLWEWQIADGIKVVDASIQINASKAGGSAGAAAGIALEAWPARWCLPRHKMPFNSTKRGF